MLSSARRHGSRARVKVVRTRRGARIVDDDVIVSEIVAEPGPTHTLFDVLAACVAVLAPGPRFALLGFAGGGMIAPLRALGWTHPVAAVDLSREGEKLFRTLAGAWADDVRVDEADAVAWLRAQRTRWHVICEDLSVPSPAGTVKPYVSFDPLPQLVQSRLAPRGVAITNVLPLPGTSWPSMLARIAHPHRQALVTTLEEYDNRFVIAGDDLPDAREASRRVRAALRALGSNQSHQVAFRTLVNG